jgi:hypothetical protein
MFIFFVRCGSGLSGEALSEEGHYWVGVDISRSMLGQWILKCLSNLCYNYSHLPYIFLITFPN